MMNKRLHALIAEMLDTPEEQIAAETRRDQIETWDSLNHLQLVTAVEREFGIKLTMDEIAAANTAGDLDRLVSARATKGI
jgi:acyl carrier protein